MIFIMGLNPGLNHAHRRVVSASPLQPPPAPAYKADNMAACAEQGRIVGAAAAKQTSPDTSSSLTYLQINSKPATTTIVAATPLPAALVDFGIGLDRVGQVRSSKLGWPPPFHTPFQFGSGRPKCRHNLGRLGGRRPGPGSNLGREGAAGQEQEPASPSAAAPACCPSSPGAPAAWHLQNMARTTPSGT